MRHTVLALGITVLLITPMAFAAEDPVPSKGWATQAAFFEAVQKVGAAFAGSDLVLKDSDPRGSPPGWSGETKSGYLAFFAPDENPAKDAMPKLELWVAPADYKGDRQPFRVYQGASPILCWAGKDYLIFASPSWTIASWRQGKAWNDREQAIMKTLGVEKVEETEQTPESLKAAPPAAEHKGWSKKTQVAVAVAEKQIDRVSSSIHYSGEFRNLAAPYVSLVLTTAELPLPIPQPPGFEDVYEPKWLRLQWLYALADNGFFDRAKELPNNQTMPKTDTPIYVLWLRASDVTWWENLGWNAETGKRLDALRKHLTGQAGKVADELLKRLEADRKAWDKAPVAVPTATATASAATKTAVPAPVRSEAPAPLSDMTVKVVTAVGSKYIMRTSALTAAAPPGWSGETKYEYFAFYAANEELRQGMKPKVEVWLAPADYKGDKLPARIGGIDTWTPILYAVGPKHLLFLSVAQVEGEEGIAQLFPNLRKAFKESLGMEKAEDPERTPASVKADPAKPAGKGWSAKTRKAVEGLQGRLAWIYIEYSPMQFGPEQRSIRFVISQIPLPDAMYPGPDIFLPRLWRDRLIYTLADDGFFDRATTDEQAYRAWPQQRGYVVRVQTVTDTKNGGFYAEHLGWNAETGKHLDALHKGMTGDAAKAMDDLLKQLEPDRKAWNEEAEKTGAKK
jgi:hypothetical protein